MKRILLPYLLFLLPLAVLGADIKGKIVEEGSDKAIPYANIFVKNTLIGVSSNEDGTFEMNIPPPYEGGMLCFSSIGYESREIKIETLFSEKDALIKLKPNVIVLGEVVVSPNKELTAEEIVQNAFASYYKKIPDKPFLAKGFLRHSEKTKKEYKWLVEAAIEVYDKGINHSPKDIKLNISEVRRSLDNRSVDSAMMYYAYLMGVKGMSHREAGRKAVKRGTVNILNDDVSRAEVKKGIIYNDNFHSNPKRMVSEKENVLRFFEQKNSVLDKRILKKHRFRLDTIIPAKNLDDFVYKIKILPQNPPAKLNKIYKNNLLPFGWIYVRAKDFAILEFEYILVNSKRYAIFTDFSGSRTYSVFRAKFIEYEGKMYPKFISYKRPKWNRLSKVMSDDIHNKVDDDTYYYSTQEIVFTEIIPNPKTAELPKNWNNDLFTPRAYNEAFWEKQNVLLETSEEQRMIKELQKKVKLSDQYKKVD